jgi:hypothetical protein
MKRSIHISIFLWLCLPFSKLINRINWRFGRPFSCNSIETEPIKKQLQPGMIILTHRNYECSSLFIPGYWTHAAMVATSDHIIDATRKGVCLNTIESFFSTVDDFIVLKPSFCCPKMMTNAGYLATNLVGYPFSFDFRNSNKVFYCSGLVCWVYAQTLSEQNTINLPILFQNYLTGYIIKPMDFAFHRNLWQVIECLI